MSWREDLLPQRMLRAAIVAPDAQFRNVLVAVADLGVFEPDQLASPVDGPFSSLAKQHADFVPPQLSVHALDATSPRVLDQVALIEGEASLEQRTATATRVGRCSVLPGWVPSADVERVRERLSSHGGAVAEIPLRRGVMAPTAFVTKPIRGALRPLVTTYATVPYSDIDPTLFAAFAYMVMFGMMFGDVGHGLAIVFFGLLALRYGSERLPGARRAAPFLLGAGVASTCFGLLYGEAFGPTGLVPTLWLRPLDEPETLLVVGVVVGACLLAVTFVFATVNRWREAGAGVALYDASGIGGSLLFAGAAMYAVGSVASMPMVSQGGIAVAVIGAVLTFAGLFVGAGISAAGFAQALVEMFDTVLRLGSNVVSFTRLAAFGLTHAVLTEVTWDGTVSLWGGTGVLSKGYAAALFVVGTAAAFTLGALVAAIQALRLEYYEMFSRLFTSQGRPFEPWHIPTNSESQ